MATGSERPKQAETGQRDELQQHLSAALPLIYALSRRETLTNELTALQAKISDLDNELGALYSAALDGGWTVELLSSANLVLPDSATPRTG